MTAVTLERLSIAMEDGKVLRWLVPDGAAVESGDVLVEVETDKATIAVESPGRGILRIVAGEGAVVAVDGVLGELDGGEGGTAVPPAVPLADKEEREGGAVSPAARRLAAERGIDLAEVVGSGPGGRIVARDLDGAIQRESAAPTEAVSGDLRDAVVRNIVASWQQIPHVQIGGELVADGLIAARNGISPAAGKVTVTDLLAFALARALLEIPELNGTLSPDGTVTRSAVVHLSLAVATADGVVAPVLRDASSRPLAELAAERARLVAAAREGRIDRRELAGGTVTLSNLGAYPVDFFAPVISGPQVAMVATGRVVDRPVAVGGWIAVRPRMWANVAVDHRAADGEAGARMLAAFERQLASLPGAVA
jgi:pyruvate dehydrogenase E2 component (dihydrolipoamide acetyltransferase)